MNDNGMDSLLDVRVISSPPAPLQGARRATEEGAGGGAVRAPKPGVVATAKRRQFSASEKRRIVSAANACKKPGELGALLRQEGIYSSMLSSWRKQIARANEQALAPRQRGPKPDPARPERLRIEQLERENARLERELQKAHLIIDVQKKNVGLARDRTRSAAQRQRRVIEAFDTLRSGLDVATACQALGVPRAAIYRARQRRLQNEQFRGRRRFTPPLALSATERERILGVLNSDRFADMAPAAVYTTLPDEGHCLTSVRAMYRVLAAAEQRTTGATSIQDAQISSRVP